MKVLGYYTISNNGSLIITELNEMEEYVRVGLVTTDVEYTSRKHKLYWTNKGAYINYKGSRIYLSEFIRSF